MPQLKPGQADTGSNVQDLKLAGAAPTAPYLLTACVPLGPEGFSQFLAVRKAEDGGGIPTDWFYTEVERTARIHGINYYEIKAYIDSGTATTFKLDRLDSPALSILSYDAISHDATRTQRPGVLIDPTAWQILNTALLKLRFYSPAGENSPSGTIDEVNLTGGFGQGGDLPSEEASTSGRMWRTLGVNNGWYRRGRLVQTFYKHIPVRVGGKMGYLHILATIQLGTPEIEFEINWHNAGVEERGGFGPVAAQAPDLLEEGGPPDQDDTLSPVVPFGQSRVESILVHSVELVGLASLPSSPNYIGDPWTWSSRLKDGSNTSDPAMRVSTNHILRPISDADPNRVHGIPLTFERPFHFVIHPSTVVPRAKRALAVCDWSKPLGGWMFTPLGLPDLTDLGSSIAGMSLTAEGAAANASLRQMTPWKGDETGQVSGIVSSDQLWPASWDAYGGATSGTGMTPFLGAKQAWIGDDGGIDLLLCHRVRDRARTYGALYYNISGIPVLPPLHAIGGLEGPWDRTDRRFIKAQQQIHDLPWLAARDGNPKMHRADYNPGPAGPSFTPTDAQSEPAFNRPDWYYPGEGGAPLPLDPAVVVAGYHFALANFSQALGYTPPPGDLQNLPGATTPDLAVPVIFQIQGAATFGTAKSITFRITGTGEFNVEVTEDVVFTGIGNGVNSPTTQAKSSAGKFKNVRDIEVISVTGTLASTELLTIGRQSVGIYDYFGFNGITALDDNHAVRYHAAMKALFLLTNNPIAFIYLMMDASDARMSYWEGTGRAAKLFPVSNGAPGRGNTLTRNWAFATDRIATGIALSHGISTPSVIDSLWDRWRRNFRTNILNSVMPANGLFQATFGFKETKFPPFGGESWDFVTDDNFMHVVATRETAWFAYSLVMLGYIYGHFDQAILDASKNMARGFHDLLWKVQGTTARGPHAYMAIAYRREAQTSINPRTGQVWNRIRLASELPRSDDIWTIFSDQASLPEENPLSKVPLNPAVYPTPDNDRFVTAVLGNSASFGGGSPTGSMSALTLVNTTADASSTPVPVTLRATGASFDSSKRRTIKVTGTDPWGVPIDDDCLGAERAGNTLVVGGTVTVLAHNFPVAARIGMTIMGGSTFSGSESSTVGVINGDAIGIRIVGTNISGQVITEDLRNTRSGYPAVCIGQGTPKQFFRSNAYFKTVTSITVTSIQGTLLSTEKFRFGTRQTYLVVNGSDAATEDHRLWQYFKTITEIIMLTNDEATEHGFSNLGTLLVGETFAFGFQDVGLRQSVSGGGILDADAFYTGFTLACWKHLGAPEADELIKRFCNVDGSQGGADTLAAAKAAMLTWGEYTGGQPSSAPYVQWAPLLQEIRDA